MKGFFVSIIVGAVVMAIAWSLMDMGVAREFTKDFVGKLIVSGIIVVVTKFLSALFGGKT